MKISTLRRISKFIHILIESGYDGNTDITTLLSDMGIATLPDNLINILTYIYECERSEQGVRQKDTSNTNVTSTIYTMITTTDIEKLITISDELCISRLTNIIVSLSLNNPLHRTMDNHVINYDNRHDFMKQNVVRAYNVGYKVLCDREFVFEGIKCATINILENCIQNGLYIKNICYDSYTRLAIDAIPITDVEGIDIDFWYLRKQNDMNKKTLVESNFKTIKSVTLRISDDAFSPLIHDVISSLPFLETIKIDGSYFNTKFNTNNIIPKYPNVQHRIKLLEIRNYTLNNVVCELFGNIKELYVKDCDIDTKSIIPHSVKTLIIDNTDIDDSMIKTCTNIRYLRISKNSDITTCAPFAKTLKSLRLSSTAIKDVGIASCTNLRTLYLNNNPTITTCEPFAKSLTKLDVNYTCGIDDNGLKLCSKLVVLNVNDNQKITTCAPFAKSLIQLYASSACGVGDDGLKSCLKLKILYANYNHKITTCVPFANSLETLHATCTCGINDDGLKLCSKLKYLDASFNPNITTCNPFANTLLYLVALCRLITSYPTVCGITDNGIKLCTKLIHLDKDGNLGITLKLPIIYDG